MKAFSSSSSSNFIFIFIFFFYISLISSQSNTTTTIPTIPTTTKTTCYKLKDKEAPLWKSDLLPAILYQFDRQTIDGLVNIIKTKNIHDSFSTCAATFQLRLIDLIELALDNECYATIKDIFPHLNFIKKNFELNPKLKEVVQEFSALGQLNGLSALDVIGKFASWMQKLPNDYYSPICDTIQQHAKTCFKRRILPLMEKLKKSTCCQSLEDSLNFHPIFPDLLYKIEDIMCASKTVYSSPSPSSPVTTSTTTCGYSLVQTLFGRKFISNIVTFAQIPTDQACLAFRGFKFLTTSKKKYTYEEDLGCCAIYVDNFIQQLAQIPMVTNFFNIKTFTKDTCTSPMEIPEVKAFVSNIQGQFGSVLEGLVNGMCMHFPSNFASSCQFASTCIASTTT